MSHLAPTYASVNALSLLDDPAALDVVDLAALARWLRSLWRPDGREDDDDQLLYLLCEHWPSFPEGAPIYDVCT